MREVCCQIRKQKHRLKLEFYKSDWQGLLPKTDA